MVSNYFKNQIYQNSCDLKFLVIKEKNVTNSYSYTFFCCYIFNFTLQFLFNKVFFNIKLQVSLLSILLF